jgi:glycosyltransferase involved in cell wall biosynthesis
MTHEQTAGAPPLELSIVMPCLNEAETLAVCVRKARRFLATSGIHGEVIVADNGSTDGSREIAAAEGAVVVPVPVKGYGAALMGGIDAARAPFVIMGDCDDSYDFTALAPFVEQLRAGAQFVMGNRFKGGIADGAMPPLHRYFGNPLLTRLSKLIFRHPFGDIQCGLRGFRKDALLSLDLRTTGMEFASESVVKASIHGLRTAEVPTTLSPDGRSRPPHMRSWRDGWRNLRFYLLYSPRWLFLIPGLLLMLAGSAVVVWLLPGTRRIGHVSFDVHTLLYGAVAILIGFQAVMFATFTKIFATSEGLLPPDPRLDRMFEYVTLETGLAVGGGMLAAGLGVSVYALVVWNREAFGALDPFQMMRTVLPALTLLTLGCEVIFASFFLSVLGLKRR